MPPRAVAPALRRPQPPAAVLEPWPAVFVADVGLERWIRATFLAPDGPLHNPDHEHLANATLGVLWTNAANRRQMRTVLATAEIPPSATGAWRRGREEQQLREWFGTEPDFLITVSVETVPLSDRQFCAIIEHELYHCAQARNEFGVPKFRQSDGRPIFALRGHDVEEFTGVVRRYGATSDDVRDLVRAAGKAPLVGDAPIAGACGTCLRAVA